MTAETENPVIRPARPEDAPRCGDIAVAAWSRVHEALRKIIGEEMWELCHRDWQKDKRAQVEEHVRQRPEHSLVTEVRGEIAGFITFYVNEESLVGQVGNNAVDPRYQGRGIGTRQCERVLEIFREKGMKAAQVITGADEGHAPARAMYERVGFGTPVGSLRYYLKL